MGKDCVIFGWVVLNIYYCIVALLGYVSLKILIRFIILKSVQRLVALKMIKSFKNVSYEAALTISGLPREIGRIHERVPSYAVKHQNHYTHQIANSHREYTLMLNQNYNIDLNNYEKCLTIPSSHHT